MMGSGADEHPALSDPVGRWIARRGCHLLTGGGAGVMAAVARSFCAVQPREGLSIGVLPRGRPADRYPNPWVEIPVVTHLSGRGGPASPSSRNSINVLTSSVVLALPGREGTRAEIELAMQYERPLVVLWPNAPDLPAGVVATTTWNQPSRRSSNCWFENRTTDQ